MNYSFVYCTESNSFYDTDMYMFLLHCTSWLFCTVLDCTVLYCTVLYCTVLYCTRLYLKKSQARNCCVAMSRTRGPCPVSVSGSGEKKLGEPFVSSEVNRVNSWKYPQRTKSTLLLPPYKTKIKQLYCLHMSKLFQKYNTV